MARRVPVGRPRLRLLSGLAIAAWAVHELRFQLSPGAHGQTSLPVLHALVGLEPFSSVTLDDGIRLDYAEPAGHHFELITQPYAADF